MTTRKEAIAAQIKKLDEAHTAKIAKLEAKAQAINAREKEAERKKDTRRKVILGALMQEHITKNPQSEIAKKAAALINEYVIGDKERELFDLEALPPEEQKQRREQQAYDRKKNNALQEI